MLEAAEKFLLHRKVKVPQIWMHRLFGLAAGLSASMAMGVFVFFTPPGRKLANKTGAENPPPFPPRIDPAAFRGILHSERLFVMFAVLSSSFVFAVAFVRAVNTAITWDEAATYEWYVLPGIVSSFTEFQSLNNHFLNSLLIRFMDMISGTRYSELIIRFPNLVFYCVYFVFAFKTAKQTKRRYFVFALFVFNYYLNEFFGLARGYGMASACVTGAAWFFERWKACRNNGKEAEKLFHLFLAFCSLAVLANPITLYIILPFLAVINFKYKKDILVFPYLYAWVVCAVIGLHSVTFSSRGGEGVYSTHNFIDMAASIPGMFSGTGLPAAVISVLFFLAAVFLTVKTKMKNDWVLILAGFCLVCILSQNAFRRGYPLMREMLPFYPVCVLIIASALDCVPDIKVLRPVFALCTAVLFYQFMLKTDTKNMSVLHDDNVRNNNTIKTEIYSYAASHDIAGGREAYERFLDGCRIKFYGNPEVDFYRHKTTSFLAAALGE